MSATTIRSTDNTTKARFLAPGTHQRADAKGKAKVQSDVQAKSRAKVETSGRATKAPSRNYLYKLSRSLCGCFVVRRAPVGAIT